MSANTLNARSAGETIVASFFNDFRTAFSGDFVGRDSSGVPASGQNLGTLALPWGTLYATTLLLNGQAVDTSSIVAPANRVVSGKVRSGSDLPQYLTPNGAALSFVVDGTPTNLVVVINGVSVSFITDITKSSLTAAPGSNNTCLVNDTEAADQFDTHFWGAPNHRKSSIIVDAMGSEITALVGKWAAFSQGSEYFLAFVKSTTELSNCHRGFFYDSTLAPVKSDVFSNNDTITLLRLGWIFGDADASTIDVTYTNPAWAFSAPGSPVTGDYWYDMGNETWKRYDGASFQIIDRTWIGMFANTTTACVAARAVDFYAKFSILNSLRPEVSTTEIVRAKEAYGSIDVVGNPIYFGHDKPIWNITTDLAGAADMFDPTEQASRVYYLYVKSTGDTIISDIPPYNRADLMGFYHPYNYWRCVGLFYNDSGSDIIQGGSHLEPSCLTLLGGNGHGSTDTKIRRFSAVQTRRGAHAIYTDSAANATQITVAWPCKVDVTYGDLKNAGFTIGISIDVDNTTASIDSINTPFFYGRVVGASNFVVQATVEADLKISQIVRPHTDGGPNTTANNDSFVFVEMSSVDFY